jgi:hypothetical protein
MNGNWFYQLVGRFFWFTSQFSDLPIFLKSSQILIFLIQTTNFRPVFASLVRTNQVAKEKPSKARSTISSVQKVGTVLT